MPFFGKRKKPKKTNRPEDEKTHIHRAASEIIDPIVRDAINVKSIVALYFGQQRTLHVSWPSNTLALSDSLYFDEYESITSMDMSVWKSAPTTDNEAPKIISKKELRKHDCIVDAWIAINGKVYDISGFIGEHPGGAEPITEAIGHDGTALFMKVHPQVNPNLYVGRNCVGIYIPDCDKKAKLRTVASQMVEEKNEEDDTTSKNNCWELCRGPQEDPERLFELKFTQNELLMVLFITVPFALIDEKFCADCWSFVLWDREFLFIKAMWSPQKCWFAQYHLNQLVDSEYLYIGFSDEGKQATIMFPKAKDQTEDWKDFGRPEQIYRNCSIQDPVDVEFDDTTKAILFYRRQLTTNVVLYGFKLRPSSYFGVPIGHSVILTVNDSGARCFPTSFTLLESQEPISGIKGQTFYFMVPQDFVLTSALNKMKSMTGKELIENSNVCIGSPRGDFHWNYLDIVDTLVLLASGVGIAPLSRILRHFKDRHPQHVKNKNVLLLYFNRTKPEIIWRQELIDANIIYPWLHLFLILEEPDQSWDQLIGTVSTHLVKWCLDAIPGCWVDGLVIHSIASGENPFITSCQKVFQNMQDVFDDAAVFRCPEEIFGLPKEIF